jgi:hypothetical protein
MTETSYDMSGLTEVFCLSDLEGFVPKFGDNVRISNVLKVIGSYDILTQGVDFFNTNGLIFCGDLIDRGDESIRLMKRMKRMKRMVRKCSYFSNR